MRHAKRTVLTADDVDSALGLRNVEVNYLPMLKFLDTCNVGLYRSTMEKVSLTP
jgi:hypothetical protein